MDKFAKSIPLDLNGNHSKITPKNVTIVTSITPQPDGSNNHNKQQLITALPSPIRKKRHRGYTFHHNNFQNMNNQYAYDPDHAQGHNVDDHQIDQSQNVPRSRSRPTIRSTPLASSNNRQRPSHSQSIQGRDRNTGARRFRNSQKNDQPNNDSNRISNQYGIVTRSRGYSEQTYSSRKATTRTPSPGPKSGNINMGMRGSINNNKLKISLAAPSAQQSPLSGPVSPATVVVNDRMDVNRELSADTTMESTSQTPNEPTPPIQDSKSIKKPNSKESMLSIDRISNKMGRERDRDKPPEIMISGQIQSSPRITIEKSEDTIDLPPPKGVLSPENSAKSDNTVNTLTTNRNRNVSGHHPSSSMFTHAPLTCWSDSNRKKTQETSAGGSADKDNDLSSLAIKVSSPRHTTSASANLSSSSMHQNKMPKFGFRSNKPQHQKQGSEQLREWLGQFGKGSRKSKEKNKQMIDNFLTKSSTNEDVDITELDILQEDIDEKGDGDDDIINGRDNNNLSTVNHDGIDSSMEILSDTPSVTENNANPIHTATDSIDLPKLLDNNTTTATVHSPPADVIENLVTHRMISSPEEKLAEVENNDDEKCEIIPVESKVPSKLREKSPVSPTEMLSDIATPIPKEAAVSPSGNFDAVDMSKITTPNSVHTQTPKSLKSTEHTPTPKKSSIASQKQGNGDDKNLPTTSLTESTLRKHNKRRASREQLQFTPPSSRRPLTSSQSNNIGTSLSSSASSNNIHFGQNASFMGMNMNIDSGIKKFGGRFHHHQTTLSEPMLPKFALMMVDHLSSEDEKSGSSDGEDRQSLGMENHLEVDDHTMDITDDDPQLISAKSRASNDLADAPDSIMDIPLVTPQKSTNSNASTKSTKLFSPTFTADSISRRSSVQLTSGVWDYITPKDGMGVDAINEQLMNLSNSNGNNTDIADKTDNMSTTVNYNGSTTTTYSPYQASNNAVVGPLSYQPATPKQHYMRRMTGPGNTSSTPTYSSYKTKHEYLRDMSYFTTLHRAQEQFKKSKRDKKKTAKDNNKETNHNLKQKPIDPDEDDAKHISFRSKEIVLGTAASDVNEPLEQDRENGIGIVMDDTNNEELEEKADSPSQKKPLHRNNSSLTSLDIITEAYDFKKDAFVITPHPDPDPEHDSDSSNEADEEDKKAEDKPMEISDDKDEEEDLDVADDTKLPLMNNKTDDTDQDQLELQNKDSGRPSLSSAINENSNHLTRHRTQLSCDTRAAIQGGIEPYQPPQKKEEENVVVVDYPSHNHIAQSAMV